MALRPPSLLARVAEPFAAGAWIFFVLWSLIVAFVWTVGLGEVELDEYITNPGLRAALHFLLGALDPAWLVLATGNIYVALAAREGLSTVRRWALLVVLGAAMIAAFSATTGLPLGPIRYTEGLGRRIGPVPFALPLLWFVLITGARSLVLHFAPRASHLRVAVGASVLATLADANLEALAWKARALWIWYPAMLRPPTWPPAQNYATWLVASFVFAYVMRETRAGVLPASTLPRPGLVFLIFNAIFLATHAARLIQR